MTFRKIAILLIALAIFLLSCHPFAVAVYSLYYVPLFAFISIIYVLSAFTFEYLNAKFGEEKACKIAGVILLGIATLIIIATFMLYFGW